MRKLLSVLAVLWMFGATTQAHALFDLRVGGKGGVNGVVWSAPAGGPPGAAAYWGDNQFYMGGGGGLFADARLFKLLGLELDLLFEKNGLTFNYSLGGFSYDYDTRFTQFRVPILAKLCLPLGPLEMTFGFGPEFVAGLNAEVTASEAIAQQFYSAEAGGDTFLDFDWALNFRIGDLFIPIGLRFRLNISQSDAFADRVVITPPVTAGGIPSGSVDAVESYSFGLNVGLGWVFFDDDDDDDEEDEDEDEDEDEE